MKKLLPFLIVAAFALPLIAGAETFELVPKGCQTGCPCSLCDFYTLAENVIGFLLKGIAVPIAAAMFVYGGALIMISGGNQKQLDTGKGAIKDAIIGLALAYFSWVILNTLLQTLTFGIGFSSSPGKWFTVPSCASGGGTSCDFVQNGPGQPQPPPGPGQPQQPPAPGPALTHQEALDLLDDSIPVRSSGNCSDASNPTCTSLDGIPRSAIEGVNRIKALCGCSVAITGGTETGHQEHGSGRAILDLDDNPTLLNYLTTNGYNFINEGDHFHVRF